MCTYFYVRSDTFYLGVIKKIKKGKVAVYTCGIDIAQTETKGTVLLHSAEEMLNFTVGEEKHLEKVNTS
jgi:T-complex protein 1 subunit theta